VLDRVPASPWLIVVAVAICVVWWFGFVTILLDLWRWL